SVLLSMSAKLTAPLLKEGLPQIGPSSGPSSPISPVLLTSPVRLRSLSGNYASKIPVLVGNSLRSQSFPFYSDFGDEPDSFEQDASLRFADPKPTLKELHADGHKMNQGIDGEDSGLGDNAEVWDEYWTEAKECDRELINELNGSLDAGLFCAVLTALLIESYKMLIPDSQDQSLAVLQGILGVLSNSTAQIQVPYNKAGFTPSSSAVRVNALWFGSLALTLGVAVQVMLAKQWLHKYGEGMSNVPRLRAQLRQYRYDNLRRWALPEMVNFLPTLLHLALASADQEIVSLPKHVPTEQAEFQATQWRRDTLQAKALAWLMTRSRNPLVINKVAQSLASLTSDFTAISILRQAGAIQRVAEQFLSCFTENRPLGDNGEVMVQLKLDVEKSEEAGLYARALVGLTEGLPASRWPQKPPRDLNLYADALDSALGVLISQTDDAEVVAFAVAAREHIFRAGRNRFPNGQAQNPTHSLGDLLEITIKIAEDDLIPGINGVVCIMNTIRRCAEATASEQRFTMWKEFAQSLLQILADTPPNCRVRDALSKCIACLGGLSHQRDYSDGNDPTEHRLIFALSRLLVICAQRLNDDEELANNIAEALRVILNDYSRSFVHAIRPLGEALSMVLPLMISSKSPVVKDCVLTMVQFADYADLPRDSFSGVMDLLKDSMQVELHPRLVQVLQRHLHHPEVMPYLAETTIFENVIGLLSSKDVGVQTFISSFLLETCSLSLRAGGKAAQRGALDPLIKAGLLNGLKDYFWHLSAIVSSDRTASPIFENEDAWIPRLLALLDLYPREVMECEIMEACTILFQHNDEGGRNLKEWWHRYTEWSTRGSKGPKPRPKGPLHRRQVV
ncbi:11152_t:CDS:2, partial [Acaulospora colombiana]